MIRQLCLAIFLVTIALVVVTFPRLQLLVRGPNYLAQEISRRASPLDALVRGVKAVESDGRCGEPQQAMPLLAAYVPVDLIQWDEEHNKILKRAVFARRFTGLDGHYRRWVLLAMLPRQGKFDPLGQDYVYYYEETDEGGRVLSGSGYATVAEAHRMFGEAIVALAVAQKKASP